MNHALLRGMLRSPRPRALAHDLDRLLARPARGVQVRRVRDRDGRAAARAGLRRRRRAFPRSCCRSASPSTPSRCWVSRSTPTGAISRRRRASRAMRSSSRSFPTSSRARSCAGAICCRSSSAASSSTPTRRGAACGCSPAASRRRRSSPISCSRPSSNDVFAFPGVSTAPVHLVALWSFAFQIYFDFSGYTDMARGMALLVGLELPLNFKRALSLAQSGGVLAALAHHALELAARLPLHPARRQSPRRRAHATRT